MALASGVWAGKTGEAWGEAGAGAGGAAEAAGEAKAGGDGAAGEAKANAALAIAGQRVDFDHLITQRRVGSTVAISLLRDGSQISVTGTVSPVPRLVPLYHGYDAVSCGCGREQGHHAATLPAITHQLAAPTYLAITPTPPHTPTNLAVHAVPQLLYRGWSGVRAAVRPSARVDGL